MNLYGFAGGDPVNFSDPFGLAACTKDELGAGRETQTNKGGDVCVERRNREAPVCFARATHFTAFAVMDATAVIGIAGVARAATGLASKTLESFMASALGVGEKAAARGVLDASGRLVQSTGAFGVAAAKDSPANVTNDVAEAGKMSLKSILQSFMPFDGTGERMDKTIAACSGGT